MDKRQVSASIVLGLALAVITSGSALAQGGIVYEVDTGATVGYHRTYDGTGEVVIIESDPYPARHSGGVIFEEGEIYPKERHGAIIDERGEVYSEHEDGIIIIEEGETYQSGRLRGVVVEHGEIYQDDGVYIFD